MRIRKWASVWLGVSGVMMSGGWVAASAQAEGVWWGIRSGSSPGYLWRKAGAMVMALVVAVLLMLLVVAPLGIAAAPAHASSASAWWHIAAGARPAYLQAGGRKPAVPGEPEVQEIDAPLMAGEQTALRLSVGTGAAKKTLGEFATEPTAEEDGLEVLSAANLQAALEGPYGAGKVHVVQCESSSAVCKPPAGELAFQVSSEPTTLPIAVADIGFGLTPTARVVRAGTPETPATPDGEIVLGAENVGDAIAKGVKARVKVTDVLPKGLKAVGVAGSKPFKEGDFHQREPMPCSLSEKEGTQTATCTMNEALVPYDQLARRISVNTEPGAAAGEENEVSIAGGGAQGSSLRRAVTISEAPVPFGVDSYEMAVEEGDGGVDTQAGSDRFQLTRTLSFNQNREVKIL
jgi:hypothetical protein